MLERFNIKMLGGAFVIVVLLCAGIYFYAERSNKRFAAELGEPPQVTTSSEPVLKTESSKVSSVEQTTPVKPLELVNKDVSKDTVASESEHGDTSETDKRGCSG